jgi:hypothetical protein
MPQQGEIVWHVLTHEHKEHSADWYWTLGLVTLISAGASAFFGNFLLAIILIIDAISIATLKVRGPREHQVKLDSRGITLDGTIYQWKAIQTFWVHAVPAEENPRLYLTTHSLLMPRIIVPLDSADHGEQVRTYCLQYVEEEQEEDRKPFLIEHIAEVFGL